MKKTKKSLVLSIVTLLLCSCMFIGSTFAWFTDTVSNTGNRIQAGTLDIGLEKWDGTKFEDISDSTDPIFNYDKWEPGYSEIVGLKVVNKGTLALKYMVNIVANGDASKLAEAIDVYSKIVGPNDDFVLPEKFDDVKTNNTFKVTPLTEVLSYAEGAAHGALLPENNPKETPTLLEANESASMIIVLHMKEEAGNEYQGLSLGSTFDINVFATQYTYEKDGFNNDQYDIDTPWMGDVAEVTPVENVYEISNGAQLAYIAQQVNAGSLSNITVKLVKDIDLNGIEWIQINGAGKSITFDGQNHTIVNLKVSKGHNAGFFSTGSGCTVKNVNFDKANVKGVGRIAVVVGHGMCVTVDNCDVKNSTVTAVVTNNDDGDKAGAIVGYLSGEPNAKVTNCAVENVTVQGYRDVGGIVGYAGGTYTVTDNTIKDSTIINDRTNNYKNYTEDAQFNYNEIIGNQGTSGTVGGNTATNVTKEVLSNESIVEKMLEEAQPGDTVVLPRIEGKYSTIELPKDLKDVTIKGSDDTPIEQISIVEGSNVQNLVLENVTIVSKNVATTASSMILIGDNKSATAKITAKNCTFKSDNYDQINKDQAVVRANNDGSSYEVEFENCTFKNFGRGMYLNLGISRKLTLKNCKFIGESKGWTLQWNGTVGDVYVDNCLFDNVCGVLKGGINNLTFTNNTIVGNCKQDYNPGLNMFSTTPTTSCVVSGNKFGETYDTLVDCNEFAGLVNNFD